MPKFEHVSLGQWVDDSSSAWVDANILTTPYDKLLFPRRATAYSAGYDIFSTADFVLCPGEDIKFPLGFRIFMEPNVVFLILPRSGAGFKFYTRLANTVGVVDADYYHADNQGHCWMKIRNEGKKDWKVKEGDAVAQGIFVNYILADGDDYKGEKRIGGFGSTSKRKQ